MGTLTEKKRERKKKTFMLEDGKMISFMKTTKENEFRRKKVRAQLQGK
jgi:hypothetical protein